MRAPTPSAPASSSSRTTPRSATSCRDYLQRQGFRVDVGDGGAALDRFRSSYGDPDLSCSTS